MKRQTTRNRLTARSTGELVRAALGLLLAMCLVAGGIAPAVRADGIPQMPHQFYGTVTFDGSLVPEGTLVKAFAGDVKLAETTVDSEGRYGYDPIFRIGIMFGAEVTFRAGGATAYETSVLQTGTIETLDLTLDAPTQYQLTVSSTAGGSVATPGEGTFLYDAGTVVSLVASPSTGYRFITWSGDVTNIANVDAAATTITMQGNYSVTANFQPSPCATISLTQRQYDLANPASQTTTITWNSASSITSIVDNGATLVQDTHYTVVDNTLTILNAYLAGKLTASGQSIVLTIELDNDPDCDTTLTVTAIDTSVVCATISPTVREYNLAHPSDVTTLITWNDSPHFITSIHDGMAYLAAGTESTLHPYNGTAGLSIKNAYLENKLTAAGQVVTLTITFADECVAFLAVSATFEEDEVIIPDINLEAAIREAIGKPTGPIYRSDLEGLTSFHAPQRSIIDLTGLEYCTGLTELNLHGNQINDISPLADLTNMKALFLASNQISDVSPLALLTNLAVLYLHNNQIFDASPLSLLTNLTRLELGSNQISDISPLNSLVNLTKLHLYGNQISELLPLSSLASLTDLDLDWNQINDISPLADLTNLQVLFLASNQISDVSPLALLSSLTKLHLCWNQISDISPLSSLTGLPRLLLSGNQNSDISPLSSLTSLTWLDLGSNQISDISPLHSLTNLTYLSLTINQISDVSPLDSLTSLTSLYLSDNQISDISPLSALTNLTWLNLGLNQISDISPLSALAGLTRLYLGWNQVSDIWPLSSLTNLTRLELYHNQISDMSPLVSNTGLGAGDYVNVRNNSLDLTPSSQAMNDIQALKDRGVDVLYEPQAPVTEIWNWYDLDAIRYNLSGRYVLMTNLDSNTAGYDGLAGPAANEEKGWEPIGTHVERFAGCFDGQGNEVGDLYANRPDESHVGLFGYVHTGATIDSIGVVNANVTGHEYVGCLVGYNRGSVSNSYSTGIANGSWDVGGLLGYSYDTDVINSYSTAGVTGHERVGGLSGHNDGAGSTVSNCYATGDVTGSSDVGGLVGRNSLGTVLNCYSTGSVTGGSNAGGVVGHNHGIGSTVSKSYAIGSVTGTSCVGGLVGQTVYGTLSDSYSSTSVDGLTLVGGLVGHNWIGTVTNCYAAGIVTGIERVGGLVGDNNKGTVNESYSMGGVAGEERVGGLVGMNYDYATVSNSYSTGSVTGDMLVGGLVGYIGWQSTVSNSYSIGSVTGFEYIGGLVGYNDGVGSTVSNSYSTGSVTGSWDVGGLVGYSLGTATNSFWDIETSGTDQSDDGTGKTTAEMMDIATFTDTATEGLDQPWDIIAVAPGVTFPAYTWNIVDKQTYPFLGWELARGTPVVASKTETVTDDTVDAKGEADTEIAVTGTTTVTVAQFADNPGADPPAGFSSLGKYVDIYVPDTDDVTEIEIRLYYTADEVASADLSEESLRLFWWNGAAWIECSESGVNTADSNGYSGYIWARITGDSIPNLAQLTGTPFGGYSVTMVHEIWDWDDLHAIRENLSGHYVVMTNLDSTTAGYADLAGPAANAGKGWLPIGSAYLNPDTEEWEAVDPFTGTFCGQGYEIKDLFIDRADEDGVGLFGAVDAGGVIENVGIINVDVTGSWAVGSLVGQNWHGTVNNSYAAGTVTGYAVVGGLVGRNWYGTVSHSHSAGSVDGTLTVGGLVGANSRGGTVDNVHSGGSVYGQDAVGGLVGHNHQSDLSNSHSSASVTGINATGGLVGANNESTVANCNASGAVIGDTRVGGLVGVSHSHAIVDNCYAIGIVEGDSWVGGLVGVNHMSTIINSHATGSVAGAWSVGGLTGTNQDGGTVDNCYATGSTFGVDYTGGLVGWNGDGGAVIASYATGDVSGDDHVGGLVGSNYLSSVSNSYSINNVVGDRWVGGLAGVNHEGTVSNSYSAGSVSGHHMVGGLVGVSFGTVSNSYSDALVTGVWNVGGLLGANGTGVINGEDMFSGTVSSCYSRSSVTGEWDVGGLVGANIHESTISDSYSSGKVTGIGHVGGLVGRNEWTVSNSFWDIETSGTEQSDGGTGKSTAEMKDIATFAHTATSGLDEPWAITAVAPGQTNPAYTWNIVPGRTYPFLSWGQMHDVWHRVDTPSMRGWVLAPESTIIDYAVAAGGDVAYAAVDQWDDSGWDTRLLKSANHAATWRDITAGLNQELNRLGLDDFCWIEKVACAPDDPDFIAVALWICPHPEPEELHILISADGGTIFRDSGTVDLWSINDLAVSPEVAGERNLAVGGEGTNGTLWHCEVVGDLASGWVDATAYDGWEPCQAVAAIEFAPSWVTDRTILAVTITGWGPNNSVHLQSGTWGMVEAWNEQAGFAAAVAIVEDVEIPDLYRWTAGIATPSDYSGLVSNKRYAWVNVNYIDTDDPDGDAVGRIFRVRNDFVTPVLFQLSGAPWLSNVSYFGTIAEGKAMAGLLGTGGFDLVTECCQGVQVYRQDDIMDMEICCLPWKPACKPPTGSLVMEAFYITADKAYAVALWGDAHDEGGWSLSFDDGDTWNQISLIDTYIDHLTDVAVSPDSNNMMLVSINLGSGCACDSVWLKAENLAFAPEYSGRWLRTWCGQLHGVHPPFETKHGLIRLNPQETDGSTVYLVDCGTDSVYYNGMHGLGCWEAGRAAISGITDLAVRNESTIYALGFDGTVTVSDDHGAALSWTVPLATGVANGWTITVWGNHILVGGQAGDVSYSTDGGDIFTQLQNVATSGLVTVAFDSYFDANSTIFAAVGIDYDEGGIFRWVIGESHAWYDLEAAAHGYTGLVLDNPDGNPFTSPATGGFLYASYVTEMDGQIYSGMARCLSSAAESCCDESAWDYLVDGLTSDEMFLMMPRALKISGGLTPDTTSKLFAIDARPYDMERGRDGTVWSLAVAPPLQVVDQELPAWAVGVGYLTTLEATGGTGPYTWTLVDGALPLGLDLDTETGIISGTPIATGTFEFTVRVTDAENLTATRNLSITITEPGDIQLSLKAGWNLVSVPVIPADPSVAAVFAGTEVVYAWNATTGSYYMPVEVEPDRGYWVAVISDTVITVSGVPVHSWTAEMTAGWNLIGSVFRTVDFSAPDTEPAGKVESFTFRWHPDTGYSYETTIEPGMGHWIAAMEDCVLTLAAQED